MLTVGTVFLYGENGVCRVEEIRRETVRGQEGDYYILKPLYNGRSTIHVPVDSAFLKRKMRRILTESEARELARTAPQETVEWIPNDAERETYFRKVLTDCDRRELIRMLKTIYCRRKELTAIGRRLHTADEAAWHSAEKIVREEMALVLRLEPDEVMNFLFAQQEPRSASLS